MFNYRTLEHPTYRPDLVPSDYNLFTVLKKKILWLQTWRWSLCLYSYDM